MSSGISGVVTAWFTAMSCIGVAACGRGGAGQKTTQTAHANVAAEPRSGVTALRESDSTVLRSPRAPLRFVADISLPGGPSRFDYQSLDAETGRLYLAHMGAGQLVVVDVRSRRVVAALDGFPRVTGVLVDCLSSTASTDSALG